MEPRDALSANRTTFEIELDGLISEAMNSRTSSSTSSRKRLAAQTPSSKRLKLESDQETAPSPVDDDSNVHPSRKVLLNRSDAHQLHGRLRGLGADGSGPELSSSTTSPSTSNGDTYMQQNTVQIITSNKPPFTIRDTVRRQWDPRKDHHLEYDSLLERRRSEQLKNVDRYVPGSATNLKRPQRRRTCFPFENLPEKVQDKIVDLVLVAPDPITIDFYWLRPFVKGHARIPTVTQKIEHEGSSYVLPIAWNKLSAEVQTMQNDMRRFGKALEVRYEKTRATRCPGRGLSTALLKVSRNLHKSASRIFYGRNEFKFPCGTSAWLQLESFQATIGPTNVAQITKLSITAPLWHRGVREDYLEGAIMDLLSPASRMAVIKPPAQDRLLSAIQHSVEAFMEADNLESMSLLLDHGMASECWSGVYSNEKRLISLSDAAQHVEREAIGKLVLKELSEVLAAKGNRPTLTLQHTKSTKPSLKEFRRCLPEIVTEAQKYEWQVDPSLTGSR